MVEIEEGGLRPLEQDVGSGIQGVVEQEGFRPHEEAFDEVLRLHAQSGNLPVEYTPRLLPPPCVGRGGPPGGGGGRAGLKAGCTHM